MNALIENIVDDAVNKFQKPEAEFEIKEDDDTGEYYSQFFGAPCTGDRKVYLVECCYGGLWFELMCSKKQVDTRTIAIGLGCKKETIANGVTKRIRRHLKVWDKKPGHVMCYPKEGADNLTPFKKDTGGSLLLEVEYTHNTHPKEEHSFSFRSFPRFDLDKSGTFRSLETAQFIFAVSNFIMEEAAKRTK